MGQNLETKVPGAKIAPSMLSSDFANLASEAKFIEECGADWLHMDIMVSSLNLIDLFRAQFQRIYVQWWQSFCKDDGCNSLGFLEGSERYSFQPLETSCFPHFIWSQGNRFFRFCAQLFLVGHVRA